MNLSDFNLTLNEELLQQEGYSSSEKKLSKSGAYIVNIDESKPTEFKTGAIGVQFNFTVIETGETAKYCSVFALDKDGGQGWQQGMLHSLMSLLGVKNINTTKGLTKEWNADLGKMVEVQADLISDFMGKTVGVVLELEEYKRADGGIGEKFNIIRFFDPETRKTATETINQKDAKEVDKLVSSLKDKRLGVTLPLSEDQLAEAEAAFGS